MTATEPDRGIRTTSWEESEREIVGTRVFDAPREIVFRAWSDPAHLGRWWGPLGFTTTTSAMEFRPGGSWRYVMHGPDGTDYENRITYVEVDEPERIVYEQVGDEARDAIQFRATVTFEEHLGKTKLTMRMVFPTAEVRAHVAAKYGAVEGQQQTIDRLEDYVSELSGRDASSLTVALPTDLEIVLTRRFDAPRARVFEALTRPKHLLRWWGPRRITLTTCEVDLRPGGAWRFVFLGPDGRNHTFRGVYREVVPPGRLVQTFIYDVEGIRDHPALETLTLDEIGGKTRLTITVRHDSKESRDGHFGSGMEGGASESYDRLADLLKSMA